VTTRRPMKSVAFVTAMAVCLNASALSAGQTPQATIDWQKVREYIGHTDIIYLADGGTLNANISGVRDRALDLTVSKSSTPQIPIGEVALPCRDVAAIAWHEYHGPMRKILGTIGLIGGLVGGGILARVDSSEEPLSLLFGGGLFGGLAGYFAGRRLDRERKRVAVDTTECDSPTIAR
jgi:hypothetical protein